MVIKPHLAVAFGLEALLARRWRVIALALAIAAGFSGLATVLLGASVWPAFLHGVAEARAFLALGMYPLHRMISVYAMLHSFGLPASVAAIAQGATALLALGTVFAAIRRKLPSDEILGLTALSTLLVSPYAYDYDLPVYGIALTLLAPALVRSGRPREQIGLLVLSLIASGYGLASSLILIESGLLDADSAPYIPSIAGASLLAILLVVWRILTRKAAETVDGRAQTRPDLIPALAGAR
jgi:hypothetical protein